MKYLHETYNLGGTTVHYLDHRLCTEVQSMMVSMVSRMPEGGVAKRYAELVEKVAKVLWPGGKTPKSDPAERRHTDDYTWEEALKHHREAVGGPPGIIDSLHGSSVNSGFIVVAQTLRAAEDRLCEYPLHPIVAEHFQKWVGDYGHSSITEHNAEPMVFIDGISRWLAWMLFDNPLVSGQEASTRALDFGKRPMCPEGRITLGAYRASKDLHVFETVYVHQHPELTVLHDDWMAVRNAELGWWKADLVKPCEKCEGKKTVQEQPLGRTGFIISGPGMLSTCQVCEGTGRKYPWMSDPQPFRPAFDRSRWALPGTISTGCAFSYSLRAASRTLAAAYDFARRSNNQEALQILNAVYETYWKAAPGLAPLVLKKPKLPTIVQTPGLPHTHVNKTSIGPDVSIRLHQTEWTEDLLYLASKVPPRENRKSYVDPRWNQWLRVDIKIQCSLAAATDWHRHRSAYPWTLRVVEAYETFVIDHHYTPATDLGAKNFDELLKRSRDLFTKFSLDGDMFRAMLCLPLGTRVEMSASMGIRDFIYMMELRGFVAGANFEYQEQARKALDLLTLTLDDSDEGLPPMIKQSLGLHLPTDDLYKQAQ